MMDQILQDLKSVRCRIDDILIKSKPSEHLSLVDEVLTRLKNQGLKAKLSKCEFAVPGVDYMGYRLDGEGIHPLEEKVQAIVDVPSPRNVSELRSFLGLLNFYGQFIPNLSTLLQPLHELLQNGVKWDWNDECESAFQKSKSQLLSSDVLVPYEVNRELILACDASPYGVGAVISHVMDDGSERPIALDSRTLTKIERN